MFFLSNSNKAFVFCEVNQKFRKSRREFLFLRVWMTRYYVLSSPQKIKKFYREQFLLCPIFSHSKTSLRAKEIKIKFLKIGSNSSKGRYSPWPEWFGQCHKNLIKIMKLRFSKEGASILKTSGCVTQLNNPLWLWRDGTVLKTKYTWALLVWLEKWTCILSFETNLKFS